MTASISRRQFLQASAAIAAPLTIGDGLPSVGAQSTPDMIEEPSRPLFRISPQSGSNYALPYTTIIFRDVTSVQIGTIRVAGSLSGPNSGIVKEHSDGNGFSWIPDARFFDTETVTVQADVPLTDAPDGTLTFRIGEQAPRPKTDASTIESVTTADPSVIHAFKSRPDLAPVNVDLALLDESRVAPGLVAVTPHVPNGQAGATIYDNAGHPVWHHIAADINHPIYCLKMQSYQGEPVLTWSEGAKRVGYGFTHFVIADQSYEPIAYVQSGHGLDGLDVHDMVLGEHGTAWAFAYHAVWTDDAGTRRNVMECVIQEIDVSTGDVWWEWHSLDHVPLDESNSPRPENPENSWDYIHVNSIEIDHDDNLLISSRANHCIYRLSTTDHRVMWRLGGKASDFALEPDAVFRWQHDARRLADGKVSLFDNVDSDNQANSRGMVFELDEETKKATLVREYFRDGGMHSPYQANMQTLENGNVFIGWGSGPRCSEFTHEGEMIFDMRYQAGVSYRGYRIEWQGFPNRPIDYLLEDGPDGTLTCFVSWNGTTEVAEWRIVTDSGAELARTLRSGFETELTGIPISAYMEVQALNAGGQILGGRVLNRGN